MQVSVVIPLFNRANLIGYTLDSLHPASHPGVELETIVIDDHSMDGGDEYVQSLYPHVRLITSSSHRGAPAARNKGIEESTSDFILLLDSDDLVEPGFFLPRIEALSDNPEADGAYGPVDHFRGTGSFDESLVIPRHTPYPIEESVKARSHILRTLRGWYLPSHAVLWRKSALQRIGGQDETLIINQDVDMTLRLLASGQGVIGCHAPRALLREHDAGRQGVVKSETKALQILELRRRFIALLSEQWDDEMARTLGSYCFDQWRALRRVAPEAAEGFYSLSKKLYPTYSLPGRLSKLSKTIGARRAARLHDLIVRYLPSTNHAAPSPFLF